MLRKVLQACWVPFPLGVGAQGVSCRTSRHPKDSTNTTKDPQKAVLLGGENLVLQVCDPQDEQAPHLVQQEVSSSVASLLAVSPLVWSPSRQRGDPTSCPTILADAPEVYDGQQAGCASEQAGCASEQAHWPQVRVGAYDG